MPTRWSSAPNFAGSRIRTSLRWPKTEQRTVVIEDIADLSAIADDYDQRGQVHYSLVLVDRGRFPRASPGTIERMVTELDRMLEEHPETTPTSLRYWL
jgi:hypothetical protein